MTDADNIQALIQYRLEQADEALVAAELSLNNGLHRSTVNRAYYSMFYSVLALLASGQAETSKHSGAISELDQWYVKPGLPKEFSRWLHDAFLNRQAADYGSELKLSREEIDLLLAHARDFLAGVRQYLGASAPQE